MAMLTAKNDGGLALARLSLAKGAGEVSGEL